MKNNKTCNLILLLTFLIVSVIIDLSASYGIKRRHNSYSHSSSSSSSHASSYSSGSSYSSYGAVGHSPLSLPVATSSASAVAHAGSSSAAAASYASSGTTSNSDNGGLDAIGGTGSVSGVGGWGGTHIGSNVVATGSNIGSGSTYGGTGYAYVNSGTTSNSVGGLSSTGGTSSAAGIGGWSGTGTGSSDNHDRVNVVGSTNSDLSGVVGGSNIGSGSTSGGSNGYTSGTGGSVDGANISGPYDQKNLGSHFSGTSQNSYNYGGFSSGAQTGIHKPIDKSTEKNYYHSVYESDNKPQKPNIEQNVVNVKKPCCKGPFPGPNGSIYDYKVPTAENSFNPAKESGKWQAPSYAPFGGSSTSTHQNTNYGSYNIQTHKKPCCGGPFPGPSGSIYDSKPALSPSGGSVSTISSTPPSKPFIVPAEKPNVNFPGASGSIYTSKPVGGQNNYIKSDSQTAVSGGTYHQTQSIGSSNYPPCHQGKCIRPIVESEIKPIIDNPQPPIIVPTENKPTTVSGTSIIFTNNKPSVVAGGYSGYPGNTAPAIDYSKKTVCNGDQCTDTQVVTDIKPILINPQPTVIVEPELQPVVGETGPKTNLHIPSYSISNNKPIGGQSSFSHSQSSASADSQSQSQSSYETAKKSNNCNGKSCTNHRVVIEEAPIITDSHPWIITDQKPQSPVDAAVKIPISSSTKPIEGVGFSGHQSISQSSVTSGSYNTNYGSAKTPACSQGICGGSQEKPLGNIPQQPQLIGQTNYDRPGSNSDKPLVGNQGTYHQVVVEEAPIVTESHPWILTDQKPQSPVDTVVQIPISSSAKPIENVGASGHQSVSQSSITSGSYNTNYGSVKTPGCSQGICGGSQEKPSSNIPQEPQLISQTNYDRPGINTIVGNQGSLTSTSPTGYGSKAPHGNSGILYVKEVSVIPAGGLKNTHTGYAGVITGSSAFVGGSSIRDNEDRIIFAGNPTDGKGYNIFGSNGDNNKKSSETGNVRVGGGLQEGHRGSPFDVVPLGNIDFSVQAPISSHVPTSSEKPADFKKDPSFRYRKIPYPYFSSKTYCLKGYYLYGPRGTVVPHCDDPVTDSGSSHVSGSIMENSSKKDSAASSSSVSSSYSGTSSYAKGSEGQGGFLSSIFLNEKGTQAPLSYSGSGTNVGGYGNSGSYSSSRSYSSSSSSSYSAASAGSYSSSYRGK